MAGGMPWILFQGNLNGTTIPQGVFADYYPELTGLLVSPLNGGGTVDPTIYGGINLSDSPVPIMTGGSSNEPFKAIQILEPGLYLFEVGLGWFFDWGEVVVRHEVTHTDGDDSVIDFRGYVFTPESSYTGYASSITGQQVAISTRTIIAIDDRATDVRVRGFVDNQSGFDRTYNNTDRTGSFNLHLIRLSPGGNSNPLGLHISQHF